MTQGRERANFETLYAAVSDNIAGGHYRPGDRIGLKALSDTLGASTTPLREALSRLVGRDVVTEQRGEGYYLARLDARDIADLYRLHHACVERAVVRSQAIDIVVAAPDRGIWHLLDEIVRTSGDRILTGVRRYLDDRLKLIRRCEQALLLDEDEMVQRCRASLAGSDIDSFRFLIADFHRVRVDHASQIADLVNRNSRE